MRSVLRVACAAALLSACTTSTERAEREPAAEPGEVADMGAFWLHRASYPTGQYSSRWQVEAARVAERIPARLPEGSRSDRGIGPDPTRFVALGPQPLLAGTIPNAGRVNVVLTHPTNPAVAWLGSDGGGVWKTTNCCSAGTTWSLKTDVPQIQNSAIGEMTLDPNDPDTLYAATGDLRFGSFSFGANGVLKSTDGGETWTVKGEDVFNPLYAPSANGFPQYQAIGHVKVDPNDGDTVVAGTKTGLYLSRDGGDSWTGPCVTNPHATQRQDITGLLTRDLGSTTELIVAVGTRGFATPVQPDLNQNGANGIYRGTIPASGCPSDFALISRPDNGWPAGSGGGTPTPTNTLGRIDLAIAPSNDNVIYAQVAEIDTVTPNILGIWRSVDGGNTWQQRRFGDVPGAGTQSWYNAGMVVHPTNPDVLFLSALEAFRSTDGGANFTQVTNTSVHVDHHARAFVGGDPNQVLLGSDGGVFYSANAQAPAPTWTSLSATLNTIELYSGGLSANFATAASASAVAGAQDNSCMVSTWNGGNFTAQAWNRRNGGDGIYSTIEPVLGQRYYYSSQYGNLRVTSSAGSASSANASGAWGAGTPNERKSFLMPIELYRYGGETTGCPAATGCGRMLAGTYRVWETLLGGVPTSSWYINSPDLTKGTLADRSFITQLHHAVSDPGVAIVGTNDGNVQYGFGLGAGVANTATWVNVTGGNAVLPNRPVMDVGTDPLNPLIGYAAIGGFAENTPATPGHIYRVECSANCASFTWRDVSGNLPNIPANTVIANPNRPNQVFAGTDWGLYYTDDVTAASPVWFKHAGLPNVMIWDMTIDRGFTTLMVFTRARGVWAWTLPLAQYTVTATASTGGTISPAGSQTVDQGTTVSYLVTPDAGFGVDSVTGCGGTLDGGLYTTAPVTAACTVQAVFGPRADGLFSDGYESP